jgi:RNA polymerase primary sigma factor
MQSIRYEFPKNLILAVGKPLRIGDPDIKAEKITKEIEEKAINVIPTLTEREQEAIYMRFQQRLTFEEMGNETNYINRQGERNCYTRERMRQIVNKAIRKMRHPSRLGRFLDDLR